MKFTLLKTASATALLMAAGMAQAFVPGDPIHVDAEGGSTLVGGTALSTLTVVVDTSSYVLTGASLSLDFDATALAFLPAASSVGGVSFASLASLWSSGGTLSVAPGHLSLAGTLLAPIDIGGGSPTLNLAFKGLRVGAQVVDYSLSLIDDLPETTSFGSHFTVDVSAVPEPADWALMLAGLAGVGLMARRRIGAR